MQAAMSRHPPPLIPARSRSPPPPDSAPAPAHHAASASSPGSGSAPSESRRPSKASLGFILSPPAPLSTPSSSSSTSSPIAMTTAASKVRPPSSTGNTSRAPIESLPRDLLGLIAYHVVIDPSSGEADHPSALLPLLQSSRRLHDALQFEHNPKLYNMLFRATFDNAALDRRYEWMVEHLADVAGRGRKAFDLFTNPRSWAIEYKSRWGMTKRMRAVVSAGKLHVEGVCDRGNVDDDLWNIWFILTENDGKNIKFLAEQCAWKEWIAVYYREDMLKDSLVPGYPKETGAKALGIWCALLSGLDVSGDETPAEIDEKIFIMRPYVFACAKYDVTYAPWTYRRLPLPPEARDEDIDIMLRSKANPYNRFGYTWRRAPPHFILGAYLVFFRLLERQTVRANAGTGTTFSVSDADATRPGLFSQTQILDSLYHDKEWQRNTICQDPRTSPGLPPLTFAGEIEGFWRGQYLFYDFGMYREILAGDLRAVYTGKFATQAMEMELKETVIRIRKEDVGGKGPLLNGGFDESADDLEEEQRFIQEGYGHELVRDTEEKDEPGWTKEILITGKCRTTWGWARIKGRVRAWDGLMILCGSYSTTITPLSRWLWRGYIHTGSYIIGRWRDSFTPENMRGYEGAWGMVRAGSPTYPAHYPKTLMESLGLNVSAEGAYPSFEVTSGNPPSPPPQHALRDADSRPGTAASLPAAQAESQQEVSSKADSKTEEPDGAAVERDPAPESRKRWREDEDGSEHGEEVSGEKKSRTLSDAT